ncbi:MAG: replicative DNA helicase [Lewinellaceae bacterium]|nr:replicative DNA helicase [Lewinellaceae bacterium]
MADQKDTDKKLSGVRGRSSNKRGEDLSNYVFGKVQPQAVPLEEAVLGALMLDKEALPIVLDILRSDSFYLDAHQLIYKAMLRLFEKSQPIDLLTVTESLKKSGDLEAVGGPYYLVELTNKVASAANIEYHARLIAQKYVQRELIRVSTKIIRDAYEDTTDVFNLLDDAEQGLFSIAQQNMSRGFESMSSLAAKAQKQIEELRKKEDGLTGVPTGFTELDRLTSGFQRSDLIIVAARPGMGKTAMTLSLARNAAAQFGKPVAFFSLEMSALQLAQRVISMEAEISGMKMRNGQLADYEWEQLNAALERVSEVPMYIDDTPGINVFELRAKARRMKMQHDIQLIIIDYLQLMSGGGDNQRGNREQEVSAISRALKGLAKELDVPVIALSQLSRAVEVRGGSKRPQLSDLRESGCLTGDALLQDARTGRRISIKELAQRNSHEPLEVIALNEEFQLGGHTLVKAFYSGRKQVFELQTRSGRRIKASANHPFLKLEGWTALESLKIGDRIAIPRKLQIQKPDNPLSKDELILLAHLIGDGCILPKQPYHYTSADLENIEIVNKTADQLFGIKGKVIQQENWWHTYLKCPFQLTHGRKHPITEWYDQLGLERVRSYAKKVPNGVFRCDNDRIALFLRHLWATDGNISWKKLKGRKPAGAIYYASSSQALTEQVQHLLCRLGIQSTIRLVAQGKYRNNFHLHIQGTESQLQFLTKVGCHGERGAIIPEMAKALRDIVANPNTDVIPKEAWRYFIEPAMKANNLSWRGLFRQMSQQFSSSIYKNGISRDRLNRINEILKDDHLTKLSNSDIVWDEIVNLAALGEEDVYDATIEGVHNFVANDVIVHNSIEQDADIVAFIYRPEYYDILEDEEGQSLKGIAEVIVAKHRHGALKTVRLRFTDEFARFSDLDDPDFGNLPSDTFESPQSNIITRPSKMNDDEDIPF